MAAWELTCDKSHHERMPDDFLLAIQVRVRVRVRVTPSLTLTLTLTLILTLTLTLTLSLFQGFGGLLVAVTIKYAHA